MRQVFKQWRQRARRENREVKAGEVPFFHSLQGKYVATYLLLVVAIVLVLNTYPLIMAQNMVFSAKEASLKRQALAIGSALAVSEVLTEDGVAQAMELLDDMQGTRVLVTNESGLILYDSSTLEKRTGDYAITAEVVKALRGEDVCRSEYRQGAFRTRVAVPTVYRGVTLGAVYLYEYDTEQAEVLLSIQSTLRYISVVICVVALVAALILSKALTRNTSRLLGGIRSVREGEYNHRIEVKGKDEMAQLAMEFNELTDRLQTIEEVRRRFVSDASHELKTPLASIRLLADSILQNSSVDMETVREFVSDIGEEADRLTRISQRLLALSRLDARLQRERVPVDVGQVVEKVGHMLLPLAHSAQVELRYQLQPHCMVLATQDDLYQVAFNLMENAVKYNQPGGSVTVEVAREEYWITLTVQDTGVGIPEEDLLRVFDRFYRVDKARSREAGGTGLGLSIARDTARLHGGDIMAQRGPDGVGARFTARFPRIVEEGGEEL
ncbi:MULTISPECIES: HAMP domain-containing sensor histidine kinase [Pseudoflavonifractor]|uniref:sensor histidine kinase n=1 Tax=Pseudoflavonifractor TaxID=1017280 RepID=UPI000B3A73FB|nr:MULTISPECIES: HAMP domain-containing sensor histidine kinase [Pseudoflavonifractor]MBM6694275.1 HAMP domain-containing histidine kinase [Pseudoflavonifractor capillosus]NJE74182.1 HAMP domain-containing histidine kinase [Pseudoflavonifractor sp. SW1122]OUN98560.1 two-component sensor histidine kinase [Pseudoflavonifractor sp. An44]OUP45433.1 two-component sensor histidine kinase [Pseudoflavonifractor sp. An187]OUP64927.1 two-component sensor histidine kinase [Pseudoflavonifractor sp. An176]